MHILGVNLSHDRSACLVSDTGDIVAIAEERLDRQKHSCPLDRLNRLFAVVRSEASTIACRRAASALTTSTPWCSATQPSSAATSSAISASPIARRRCRGGRIPILRHHQPPRGARAQRVRTFRLRRGRGAGGRQGRQRLGLVAQRRWRRRALDRTREPLPRLARRPRTAEQDSRPPRRHAVGPATRSARSTNSPRCRSAARRSTPQAHGVGTV